ncbi:hypothetical protein NCER_101562 [Vairimorpha ceranae BRL01]|uniref:Uncharacterized protein n=2 Tax=Vairimorpha ceranae TaxID=40302 RepID=C4VAA7_VAIC1|nr:hypothetical protein AAJ76_3300012810 [Vairimorpha ceranae]EEQ81844.1 hypothetical protein NCER_101562 [Vairimorpha ceranae BRL01]KAF5139586.1 hypothetical protein G9O61_00g022610 [Vairimorpha ceranae]KKO75073.1 hypothetical protein AAJ76_3300012810 [Vairimorpha ceranae]
MDDDSKIKLNQDFLKEAEEYARANKPMIDLFVQYRKHYKSDSDCTFVDNSDYHYNLSFHNIQSSDDDCISDKIHNIIFKNSKDSHMLHKCVDSEIYKFIAEYFDYDCPAICPTYRKKRSINNEVEVDDFQWPFLEPPKKPRTVFDKGPTREEIGEYNRRIFAAYTEYLNFENNVIYYEHNPNFTEEGEDEEFCQCYKNHLFKAEVESYLYNGSDYIFQEKSIVRISRNFDDDLIFCLQGNKHKILSTLDTFKLYYIENDGKVDLFNVEDMTISRFLFCNDKHCKDFYEYFDVPCEI